MASYSDYNDDSKSAAELEREAEEQRRKVESTIGQISEKLSPGQLVDELLSYTKTSGGDFLANLGRSAAANPLPVALLGVSLVWLMARPGGSSGQSAGDRRGYTGSDSSRSAGWASAFDGGLMDDEDDDDAYGYAVASGSLRRTGRSSDDTGHYSEFMDDAGVRYRAPSDEQGNRLGHFLNDAGETFRGFVDAAGNRISQIKDEAGNLLSGATGWASDSFDRGRRTMHDARDAVSSGASRLRSGASGLGSRASKVGSRAAHLGSRAGASARSQGGRMMSGSSQLLQDQPLIGAALAFAAGAAVGAVLPLTRKENEVLGETADAFKEQVKEQAGEAYAAGKEQAANLYRQASEAAGEIYGDAKSAVSDKLSAAGVTAGSGEGSGGASSASGDTQDGSSGGAQGGGSGHQSGSSSSGSAQGSGSGKGGSDLEFGTGSSGGDLEFGGGTEDRAGTRGGRGSQNFG